jgi:hypothetical protein
MTKKFYTDKDIEDLFRSGVKSLHVDDDVVLTDLAFEKARKLGLLVDSDAPPAAPVRPYLSERKTPPPEPVIDPVSTSIPPLLSGALFGDDKGKGEGRGAALEKRIREKVAARLGNQIDPHLLDAIIKRTLKVTGLK